MRAILFGKVGVQDHGVPVQFGRSFITADATLADGTLSVNSASPFCQDMVPFKMDIDPTGTPETVMVRGISGKTFTVRRGIDGTEPVAHGSGAVVVARFPFAAWDLRSPCGGAGKTYWGKNTLVASSGVGVIKEFVPNPASAAVSDSHQFMASGEEGNPLNLSDYGVDVDVDGQALFVTLWER